jgi:hypothetical protein
LLILSRGITTKPVVFRGVNPTLPVSNLKGVVVLVWVRQAGYLVGHCLDYLLGNAAHWVTVPSYVDSSRARHPT